MSIDIRFLTVVISRAGIDDQYPGGVPGFLGDYESAQDDGDLFGISVMSVADADAIVIDLARAGVDVQNECATLDQMRGPVGQAGAGTVFERLRLRRRDGDRFLSCDLYVELKPEWEP